MTIFYYYLDPFLRFLHHFTQKTKNNMGIVAQWDHFLLGAGLVSFTLWVTWICVCSVNLFLFFVFCFFFLWLYSQTNNFVFQKGVTISLFIVRCYQIYKGFIWKTGGFWTILLTVSHLLMMLCYTGYVFNISCASKTTNKKKNK